MGLAAGEAVKQHYAVSLGSGDTMAKTRPTELYYPELYYLVKHRSMLRALLKATSIAASGNVMGCIQLQPAEECWVGWGRVLVAMTYS
eukprot:gene153-332_t